MGKEDSTGVSTPGKVGSMEAAAPGMAVKGEGTCSHAQGSGWTARWVAGPFCRTEHGVELGGTGSMLPTIRGINFQEQSAHPWTPPEYLELEAEQSRRPDL